MLPRLPAYWASEPYRSVQHAIAVCVALLLLFAALVKVGNLPLFARAVLSFIEGRTYGDAIPIWSLAIAASVFAIEMSVGISLLIAPLKRCLRLIGIFIFVVFAAAQFRLAGMETGSPCGCFGMFQGAMFLKPFSTPPLAAQTNLIIAGTLASLFLPFGGDETKGTTYANSIGALYWMTGAFLAVGFVLGRYQSMLWGDSSR